MFLFKYERFIHAFLMFWWLFVRSINQAKNGGQKGHFCIISEYHSPRLATNSPGRVSTFSIKQPTHLGELVWKLLLFFYKNLCKGRKNTKNQKKKREETCSKEGVTKWSPSTADLWPWITSFVISLVDLVLYAMIG